jgi:hypothetical protein
MVEVQTDQFTFQERTVLELMHRHHADTVNTLDKLDLKAISIIQVSSVIISIISGFQLVTAQATSSQAPDKSRLILILAFYIATFVLAVWALFPKAYFREPVKANWDDIRDTLKLSEDDFYFSLLTGYEQAILRNQEIIDRKSRLIQIAYIALGVTVGTALLSAIL